MPSQSNLFGHAAIIDGLAGLSQEPQYDKIHGKCDSPLFRKLGTLSAHRMSEHVNPLCVAYAQRIDIEPGQWIL